MALEAAAADAQFFSAARSPRAYPLRSPDTGGAAALPVHEALTDTVRPGPPPACAAAGGLAVSAACCQVDAAGGCCVPLQAVPEDEEVAAAAAFAGESSAPEEGEGAADGDAGPLLETLESGRQLWRDFFAVAPITTAVVSTSLDFIAP